jgi:hypothetical protein
MAIEVNPHLCCTQMAGRRMATLSELAATIAKAEGMDPATVALTARYVREAGFIEKRGRGPSAASMGVKDAANLLIAINAASSVGAAAAVVRDYRGLIAINDDSNVNGTFGEALELLIKSAIERKLPSTFLSEKVPDDTRDAFEREEIVISIRFERPTPSVFLEIGLPASEKVSPPGIRSFYIPPAFRAFFIPKHSQEKRTPRKMNIGDRRDQTTIGNVTIFAIAEKLR